MVYSYFNDFIVLKFVNVYEITWKTHNVERAKFWVNYVHTKVSLNWGAQPYADLYNVWYSIGYIKQMVKINQGSSGRNKDNKKSVARGFSSASPKER